MVHNHDSYISAINIFLIILSVLGIILTATLSFIIPEVLGFTRTHYATCSVLVAGLVSFPASIKIKFNEDSPILAKIYGHTSSFRNLTVAISLGLNGIAIIVCLFTLITNKDFTHDFFQLMKFYNSKHSSKLVVNEIQGTLQCCGSHCYKDWFRVNWKGFENQDQWSDNCEEEEEEDNGIDVSSVPYSCCKTRAPTSCGHYDLRMFSTITINEQGCAKRIRLRTLYYVWFLLAISLMSVFCEIWVLVLTSRNSGHDEPTTTQTELPPTTSTTTQSSKAKVTSKKPSKKSTKSPKSAENQDYTVSYSALLNDTAWETYSKAAEIEPSSHSELIFVAHQDFSYDET